MNRLHAYLIGVVSGITAAVFVFAIFNPFWLYSTTTPMQLALGEHGQEKLVLPEKTKLTHTWSASEGFEQYCLSVNVEGRALEKMKRENLKGFSPYWLGSEP